MLRGWWCEEPSRQAPEDAGEVEWRLLRTAPGQPKVLDARWRYGTSEPFRAGWNLARIDAPEPADLGDAFQDPARFCHHP